MPAQHLPETFGRYRVLKPLGSGAMGAVYLAEDTQLERRVALKVPTFDGNSTAEMLARFYREARTAATLRHPHICPIYDVGEIDGRHYLSMAYLDGQLLSDVIKAGTTRPERPALSLIRKLALALQEAHDHGIVHRDLKPANVMIDGKREPVIMDFGLACQVRDNAARLTQRGVIVGSPAYMSPEQLEGDPEKIAGAADQYSLGVILFEMLSGQLPFRGALSAVIGQIASKPTPALSSVRADVDPRIDALCGRMMAKSAAERFPSMKAVADEITRILAAAPKPADEQAATSGVKAAEGTDTIVSDRDRWVTEIPTLLALARNLYRKHDYAETRKVLSKIPAGVRTPEVEQLLNDAVDKDDECCLLLTDIEQALQQQTPTDLQPMLKRLLQLKPGHKQMQQLSRDIQQYGVEKAVKIRRSSDQFTDPGGKTIEPKLVAMVVGGLIALCATAYFAASAFQSPHGTIIVNVADPNIAVTFAEQKVTATEPGQSFSLKPGEPQELRVEVHGVSINEATRTISVNKNETKTITAKLQPDGSLDVTILETRQTFTVADAVQKGRLNANGAANPERDALPRPSSTAVASVTPSAPTAPTNSPPAAPEKPTRRVMFMDEFDKSQPYWTNTTAAQLKENPNHIWGFRDGIMFDEVKAPSWYFGSVPGSPFSECTWEMVSRVTGDNPGSRGSVVFHILQPTRGIQVRIDGAGVLWIAPSSAKFSEYASGPWVGPITHRAIRAGGAGYNKIRMDLRKRRLNVYVNDVAVVNPLEFNWDLIPASLFWGVDCQSPSVRAEHERAEIGELREPLKGQDDAKLLEPVRFLANGAAKLNDGTHCYEGAGLKVAGVTAGTANPQWDLQTFQGIWTNDCQLLWFGAKATHVLTLDLPIEADGLYQIVPGFTLGPDFGRVKLALDGKPLYGDQPIDLFDPRVQPAKPISLGTLPLSPGQKKLTITIVGKNRGSTGFVFGLDELRLIPVR